MILKKKQRIPTIIALILLVIALGLGILIFYYSQKIESRLRNIYLPKAINRVNITGNSATITWQTEQPAMGQIIYGQQPNLLIFESGKEQNTLSDTNHFVTLSNLKPSTSYYFQIKSQDRLYPQKPMDFITGPNIQSSILSQSNKPIRGTVIDPTLQPINNALVFFKLNGTAKVATYTSSSGNFILPLKELRTSDLQRYFDLKEEKQAELEITKAGSNSHIKIKLPPTSSLEGIILGQNVDLSQIDATPEATLQTPTPQLETVDKNFSKFDLNKDSKVNSLDLILINQAIERKKYDPKQDANDDGKLDRKDFDLIRKSIK